MMLMMMVVMMMMLVEVMEASNRYMAATAERPVGWWVRRGGKGWQGYG